MIKKILIIGSREDPHITSVIKHLEKSNAEIYLINPYEGKSNSITYSYHPFEIKIKTNNSIISGNEINSVWWRLKPNVTGYPENLDEYETQNFIKREWQLALEPLKFFLKDAYWMNTREADLLVRNKPYQLFLANKKNFKIPYGLISNDIKEIETIFHKNEPVLYKPLSYFIVPPKKVLYANLMTKSEVLQKQKNIELAPCIFQKYISKAFELRVTVVGNKIFAAKIHSQQKEKSKLDWRRDQLNINYEVYDLDIEFEQKLLELHKAFNLKYGAYDFIVDENGEIYFLEVNPVGQWLWIENDIDLPISKAIADELLI